jgi:hypothetical protein
VFREYPHLQANVSPFGTSKAVEGRVRNSSLTMELKRDGVSLGTDFLYNSRFYAPARDGRYTLDLHATRHFVALSTDVHTTWEFSSPADGKLPLLEVDYALPLDLCNSWKAGARCPRSSPRRGRRAPVGQSCGNCAPSRLSTTVQPGRRSAA